MFFKQLATKDASLSYFFGCAGHANIAASLPASPVEKDKHE